MKRILVTGGLGFIGSALIRHIIKNNIAEVLNVDKITYAGNFDNLKEISDSSLYNFECADICNHDAILKILKEFKPYSIMHLAAESHVDRSIEDPLCFVRTNVVGTVNLLNCAFEYWKNIDCDIKDNFRFQHISTDEVYGSLGNNGLFTEDTKYDPKSPYSASKASSDHFVRAYHNTYGFPIVITNCSNNYGEFQYPEKLIPVVIINALEGNNIPVYGNGMNIRDWIYVEDHVKALIAVNERGVNGSTYNIGAGNEKTNIDIVCSICLILDELIPKKEGSYISQIVFVNDRKGHDLRYAIDASKISNELGWKPDTNFEEGLKKTVKWYLDNKEWWKK